MLELLGVVFGGVSRLIQGRMELQDKQREREHEAVMFDKQVALQASRQQAEADLRRMDIDAAQDAAEFDLLAKAISAQADEAKAAKGWVAKLSAFVRPGLTIWHAGVLYTLAKIVMVVAVFQQPSVSLTELAGTIVTEFDRVLIGSMMSFWFVDRSLRRAGK
jgi:hypothetical protein